MNEIKYTTDGRKVVVIGNLNSKEIIVQEIFIVNGAEIPQGENFIVKSLLDAPGVSWKQQETTKWDVYYEQARDEYDKRIQGIKKATEILRFKLEAISKTARGIAPDAFQMVSDFLLGKLRWAFRGDYNLEIADFSIEKDLASFWDSCCEGLKLISLMGISDGSLQWNINQYRDGSGSGRPVFLFSTKEEAIAKAIDFLNARKQYSEYDIAFMEQWGIASDMAKLKEYRDRTIKSCSERSEKATKELAKALTALELAKNAARA